MTRGDWQRLLHMRTYCGDIAGFIERFGANVTSFSTDRGRDSPGFVQIA